MISDEAIKKIVENNGGVFPPQHFHGYGPRPPRAAQTSAEPHKGEPVKVIDKATGQWVWVHAVGSPTQKPKRPSQWPARLWDAERHMFVPAPELG